MLFFSVAMFFLQSPVKQGTTETDSTGLHKFEYTLDTTAKYNKIQRIYKYLHFNGKINKPDGIYFILS